VSVYAERFRGFKRELVVACKRQQSDLRSESALRLDWSGIRGHYNRRNLVAPGNQGEAGKSNPPEAAQPAVERHTCTDC
jgi:hypothetical protein